LVAFGLAADKAELLSKATYPCLESAVEAFLGTDKGAYRIKAYQDRCAAASQQHSSVNALCLEQQPVVAEGKAAKSGHFKAYKAEYERSAAQVLPGDPSTTFLIPTEYHGVKRHKRLGLKKENEVLVEFVIESPVAPGGRKRQYTVLVHAPADKDPPPACEAHAGNHMARVAPAVHT
jgi:hypothetical protein